MPLAEAPRDRLRIERLSVATTIGVRDWERVVRQHVHVDLELAIDARRAAAEDQLADALDYGAVARHVEAFVAASAFRLVESLAEAIAGQLIGALGAQWARVTVHKPRAVPNAADVSVTIERSA